MLRRYFKILSILISPTLLSVPTHQKNFAFLAPTSECIKITTNSKVKPSIVNGRQEVAHLVLDDWGWNEEDLLKADPNNYCIVPLILRLKEEKNSPDMMQVIEAWRVIAQKEKEFNKLIAKSCTPMPQQSAYEILETLDLTVYSLFEMETTFSEILLRELDAEDKSKKIDWDFFEKELYEFWWNENGRENHQRELDRQIDAGLAAMTATQTSL